MGYANREEYSLEEGRIERSARASSGVLERKARDWPSMVGGCSLFFDTLRVGGRAWPPGSSRSSDQAVERCVRGGELGHCLRRVSMGAWIRGDAFASCR